MIALTQLASDKLQNIMTEKGLQDYALRVFVIAASLRHPKHLAAAALACLTG